MFLARSERRRVRGKDCVRLKLPFDVIFLNSLLPDRADAGRDRKELM